MTERRWRQIASMTREHPSARARIMKCRTLPHLNEDGSWDGETCITSSGEIVRMRSAHRAQMRKMAFEGVFRNVPPGLLTEKSKAPLVLTATGPCHQCEVLTKRIDILEKICLDMLSTAGTHGRTQSTDRKNTIRCEYCNGRGSTAQNVAHEIGCPVKKLLRLFDTRAEEAYLNLDKSVR